PGLAAVPAELPAPEGDGRIHRLPGVNPHGASAKATGQRLHPADITCPDAAGQIEPRCVCESNDVLDVVERDSDDDRAEDLFVRDPHAGVHIGEDGRGDKVPAVEAGADHRLTTGNCCGSLRPAEVEVTDDAIALLAGNERPHLRGRIEAVAHPEPGSDASDAADDIVVDRSLHEQAGPGAADL